MEITVKMSADDFTEFMEWRKNKNVFRDEVRKIGKEIEDLANNVFEALAECESEDTPRVKIKNQEAAIRLLESAAEVF